jgi:hypothetical protein
MLHELERKILRRMGGLKQEKMDWRHRRPGEIYCHYELQIKLIRLGLAGNSRTVEEEMVLRRIVNGKFHSTKLVGKPRRRWEDTAHR